MKKYTYTETKDTRSGFGAGLLEAARKNPNIVGEVIYIDKVNFCATVNSTIS